MEVTDGVGGKFTDFVVRAFKFNLHEETVSGRQRRFQAEKKAPAQRRTFSRATPTFHATLKEVEPQ